VIPEKPLDEGAVHETLMPDRPDVTVRPVGAVDVPGTPEALVLQSVVAI
jgi:hypothetical protein